MNNPFEVDTAKYRSLLDGDSHIDDQSDLMDHLTSSTVDGLPPSIFQAVKKQQDQLNLDKKKKAQVAEAFENLFSDLNKKYGLNVVIDFDSFTTNISNVLDPSKLRAAEYYLSEAYGRFRVTLYGQFLQAIALLAAQILDPNYLLSESMTYTDKLDTMDRLYQFMTTMNEIYEKVKVPDTELKLEKLATNQRPTYDLNDPKIREFMETQFKLATSKNK